MEENNRSFTVTGSILVRLNKSQPIIDMMGCNAYIMAETGNTYSVRFHVGTPYIVSKEIFMANTKPGIVKDMNYHEIHDITLLLNGVQKKTYRGVLFGHEDELSRIKENALRWFNLEYGVHWDDYSSVIRHTVGEKQSLNQITAKQMAKKTTTEVATTAQSEFELRSKEIGLPTIPSTMVIGGVTFSEELIKKELDEVKKIKVEAPLPTDTREMIEEKKKVYDLIVKKKGEFVKTRTQPEKFRTEISKPLNAWIKELKSRTDSFGALAKEGEQYCLDQAKIYEDWEAEQERIKADAEAELVKRRTLDLQSVLGIVNPQSLHWTFKHNPMLVEHSEIVSMDDSEWNGVMKELEDSYKAAEAQAEADRQALIAAQNGVITARTQMLQLMQYAFDGSALYSKNGHTVNAADISKYSDADWMGLLTSHNTPKEAAPNPFGTGQTSNVAPNPFNTPAQAQPVQEQPAQPAFNNPFAQGAQLFGAPIDQPVVEQQEQPAVQEEGHSVAFGVFVTFTEEKPFSEFVLNKSTIRIYPIDNEAHALDIPNRDARHMYSGRDEQNGLCYIMFKNV